MSHAKYDSIAAWYDAWANENPFLESFLYQPMLSLLGDVDDKRVCDVACGQGNFARILSRFGAKVTGIDLSHELIQLANQRTEEAGPQFIVDDAQELSTQSAESYDVVVMNLALMDIPNLDAVLRSVYRILRKGGMFAFSITHPCFEAPHAQWITHENDRPARLIIEYFGEGFWKSTWAQGVRGKVGAHHRTLATYLNALVEADFRLERIVEPSPEPTTDASEMTRHHIAPTFMLVRCAK